MPTELIVSTSDSIEGFHVIEYLGVVRGLAVRIPTPSQGFQALGSMLGGNINAGAELYEDLCESTRAAAYARLVQHAQALNADAVIAMRYDATNLSDAATEVLAYGTAVKLVASENRPVFA